MQIGSRDLYGELNTRQNCPIDVVIVEHQWTPRRNRATRRGHVNAHAWILNPTVVLAQNQTSYGCSNGGRFINITACDVRHEEIEAPDRTPGGGPGKSRLTNDGRVEQSCGCKSKESRALADTRRLSNTLRIRSRSAGSAWADVGRSE